MQNIWGCNEDHEVGTSCHKSMIPHLYAYTLRAGPPGYIMVISNTPTSNCFKGIKPQFLVCTQCFYDHILQRLETVVSF